MKILADASLPGLTEAFPSPFHLSLYHNPSELPQLLVGQNVLLCRASLKVNQELLAMNELTFVATASSGSDNLDKAYLKSQGINFFDAKGCNATSVADYVLSCLALLEQKQLIRGSKVGVIGLGHVGSILAPRLRTANFDVSFYDPLKALHESDFTSCELEELYQCDVLCVHAELQDTSPYPSVNLINKTFLDHLKPHCIIINASRGGIVNEQAILNSPIKYCTDVYLNEPHINKEIIERALICTPHIAGHSLEAKFNAVTLISRKIHQILDLPLPEYLQPIASSREIHNSTSWQDLALSFYNPSQETKLLKEALDIEKAFLELRHAHNNRHDFSTYFADINNSKFRGIFI